MRFLPFSALVAASLVCHAADRALDFPELAQKVQAQALKSAGGRRIRLAVAPFTPAGPQRWQDRGFGGFLTERLFASLGEAGPLIRLFERGRLDAVLKEQKLSDTGLFTDQDVRRLGELAPIDVLLTGTFTRLKGSVAVHGRFIDVVSGEVTATFSEQVGLTPSLAGLFSDDTPEVSRAEPAKPAEDPCPAAWAPIRRAMEDLGTPEKLDRLVDAAVAIPFEGPCGDIHHALVRHLIRYRQDAPRYRAFLTRTLAGIQDPDSDPRVGTLLRGLKYPGELEPEAWDAAFRTLARSGRFLDHLDDLLRPADRNRMDLPRMLARAGLILESVAKGGIGKPLPLTSGETFSALLGELHSTHMGTMRDGDPAPVMAFLRKYGPRYMAEGDRKLVTRLIRLVQELPAGEDRDLALTWLGERLARFPDLKPITSDVCVFMDRLFTARSSERDKGRWEGPAARDLNRLATLTGRRLPELLPHIQGRGYRIHTQALCLEHGLKGEGVPTEAELIAQLRDPDFKEKDEVLTHLEALGTRARSAEAEVLRQFLRGETVRDWDSGAKYFHRGLMACLTAFQTRDEAAIRMMIRHLSNLEPLMNEAAIRSLARLGEPATRALKAAYATEPHVAKMRIAKTFQRMGALAKPHLPWLRARLAERETVHLQAAFEDAIQAAESSP